MKTSLKLIALSLALTVPGALAAESLGLSLPARIDALDALVAFGITLFALIVLGDYAPRTPRLVAKAAAVAVPAEPKASHPLAA